MKLSAASRHRLTNKADTQKAKASCIWLEVLTAWRKQAIERTLPRELLSLYIYSCRQGLTNCTDLNEVNVALHVCNDEMTTQTCSFRFRKHLTLLRYIENRGNHSPSQHSIRVSSENLWIHSKSSAIDHKCHFLWSHCLWIDAWRQSMALLGVKIFCLSFISILEVTTVCVFRSRQHAAELGAGWAGSVSVVRI